MDKQEIVTAHTFVEQGKRYADPVKQRSFAVERTQSALKCDRAHAETLVDAVVAYKAAEASAPLPALRPGASQPSEPPAVETERVEPEPPAAPPAAVQAATASTGKTKKVRKKKVRKKR